MDTVDGLVSVCGHEIGEKPLLLASTMVIPLKTSFKQHTQIHTLLSSEIKHAPSNYDKSIEHLIKKNRMGSVQNSIILLEWLAYVTSISHLENEQSILLLNNRHIFRLKSCTQGSHSSPHFQFFFSSIFASIN